MENKRSKKRNQLTKDAELVELAYVLHVNARRLRDTVTAINIPAAYRVQLLRHVQWMLTEARNLGAEMSVPEENSFFSKEGVEEIAEKLGLFG